jgi:DNA-directed RNA polymerase subunit RPC12/RpoP
MTQENQKEIRLTWEMVCSGCKAGFEVEVPRGPREERELKCPQCGSKEIGKKEASAENAPACGG